MEDILCLQEDDLHELLDPFLLPSYSLTLNIEKYIPLNGFTTDKLLKSIKIPESISLHIFSESIELCLNKEIIKHFINSIKVEKDLSYINMGDANLKIKNLCKRELRQNSYMPNRMQQIEINHFLEKLSFASDKYQKSAGSLMKLLLKLWSEYPNENTDSLIYNKKSLIQKQIDAVKIFEEQYSSKFSMDYLMMNRLTPPPINIEESEKLLRDLDNLSLLLFNQVTIIEKIKKEMPEIRRGDRESAE